MIHQNNRVRHLGILSRLVASIRSLASVFRTFLCYLTRGHSEIYLVLQSCDTLYISECTMIIDNYTVLNRPLNHSNLLEGSSVSLQAVSLDF